MTKKNVKTPLKKGIAKVPIIMQLEALECGAASLCMVMAYYKKWIPIEVVRTDCGVSRDGANALAIVNAAKSSAVGTTWSGWRRLSESTGIIQLLFELRIVKKENTKQ